MESWFVASILLTFDEGGWWRGGNTTASRQLALLTASLFSDILLPVRPHHCYPVRADTVLRAKNPPPSVDYKAPITDIFMAAGGGVLSEAS